MFVAQAVMLTFYEKYRELSKVNSPGMSWMEPGLGAMILTGGPELHWRGQRLRQWGLGGAKSCQPVKRNANGKAGRLASGVVEAEFTAFTCAGGGDGLVAKSCPTLSTPWTVAHQTPLSMGFSRQEYGSGLPLPSPGDLPNTGIKARSAALQADSLLTELWGKLSFHVWKPKEREGIVRSPGLGAEPPPLGFVATWTDTLEAGEGPRDHLQVGRLSASQSLSWCRSHSRKTEQNERLLLNRKKMPGFLASGREKFNPGPETSLDHSELLCNKVFLTYKGDRESFWHRHQKGAERVPPC